MIKFEELDSHEKNLIMLKGKNFFEQHKIHVWSLLKGNDHSYSPSGSDLYHPELWKPAHWEWYFCEVKK